MNTWPDMFQPANHSHTLFLSGPGINLPVSRHYAASALEEKNTSDPSSVQAISGYFSLVQDNSCYIRINKFRSIA